MESNPPNPSSSPRGLTLFIRSWLPLFTTPLRGIILMVHGYDNDINVMNDPDVNRELYEQAKSKDKTLKIYDGMMHSLLFGETDDNVEIVWSDIL
ncbi:Caffeoylshikimate esterase [Camellia lanceoleosa]|uniref:Caffeoylshikimate esterase n=1 Tax=Camellia lanceoleosa TaxID=1840588 RepID=A0ACC0FBT9_9ERIC|nr:Caffeoylshikimate esterase [Camellia lanceoleosa]